MKFDGPSYGDDKKYDQHHDEKYDGKADEGKPGSA